ncbi:MAG: hypothetical protein Q4A09_09560 [Capnocytophaga felis]|nr:hypothetical protein [Capnocytophaga felis]
MKTYIGLLMLLFSLKSVAQINLKANLQTNHLWRGIEVADGLVITSDLNYSLWNGRINFGFWGGTNMRGTYKEFNNHISFQHKGFSFALWDIYNFSAGATYNNKEFFNYNARSTGRFLDASLSYRCGERFPLLLSWSTILFGRDRNKVNTANKYSTFCYLEYPIHKKDLWQVDAGIGGVFALNKAGDNTNFYGDKAGIVHISLKATYDWTIAKHTVPVHACMMWNPQADRAFFQLGMQVFSF